MKKLFLLAAVFGSIFFTSCEPDPVSESSSETQLTEGEDGEIQGEDDDEEDGN